MIQTRMQAHHLTSSWLIKSINFILMSSIASSHLSFLRCLFLTSGLIGFPPAVRFDVSLPPVFFPWILGPCTGTGSLSKVTYPGIYMCLLTPTSSVYTYDGTSFYCIAADMCHMYRLLWFYLRGPLHCPADDDYIQGEFALLRENLLCWKKICFVWRNFAVWGRRGLICFVGIICFVWGRGNLLCWG